jgi:hypothetical protein
MAIFIVYSLVKRVPVNPVLERWSMFDRAWFDEAEKNITYPFHCIQPSLVRPILSVTTIVGGSFRVNRGNRDEIARTGSHMAPPLNKPYLLVGTPAAITQELGL